MRILTATSPLLFALALALASCQSQQHTVTPASSDQVSVCRLCYDISQSELRTWFAGKGRPRDHLFEKRVHQCPDCASEVVVSEQGETLVLQCARCAPAGVACDRCRPRDQGTPAN
jgi:hypothetical protein